MLLWNAIEWTRPWGFVALLLPLLILLLARQRGDPHRKLTGALEIWRRVDAQLPAARGQRERIPPGTIPLLAALVLGTVALAGPRIPLPPTRSTWTLVVDRSPSTHLQHEAGGTRLERALLEARKVLDEIGSEGDLVRWQSPQRPSLLLPMREEPGAEWLRGEAWTQAPTWSSWREAGCIWVTDREPTVAGAADGSPTDFSRNLGSAGLVASGGAAVAGPIEIGPTHQVRLESGELQTIKMAWQRPFVELRGTSVPEPIERMLGVWCDERGLELRRSLNGTDWEAIKSSKAALQWIVAPPDGPTRAVVSGRDGWIAEGAYVPVSPPDPMRERSWDIWLADSDDGSFDNGRSGSGWLIAKAPGLIWSSWVEMQEPGGDPAAFALSFGELCDRSALAPEQVIPLAEREAAGGGRTAKPKVPESSSVSVHNSWLLPFWLIVSCSLFAALYVWRRFRSFGLPVLHSNTRRNRRAQN